MAERLGWPSPTDLPTVNIKLKRFFEIIDAGMIRTVGSGGGVPTLTGSGPLSMPSQQTLALVDTSGGSLTLTLPSAATVTGYSVVVKVAAGVLPVLLAASGSDLIDGVPLVSTSTEIELVSVGNGWVEI